MVLAQSLGLFFSPSRPGRPSLLLPEPAPSGPLLQQAMPQPISLFPFLFCPGLQVLCSSRPSSSRPRLGPSSCPVLPLALCAPSPPAWPPRPFYFPWPFPLFLLCCCPVVFRPLFPGLLFLLYSRRLGLVPLLVSFAYFNIQVGVPSNPPSL